MGIFIRLRAIVFLLAKRATKFVYHDMRITLTAFRWWLLPHETVKTTHDGKQAHTGGIYAIFLIWQPREIPWYVRNALQALDEAGVNTIIVANHDLNSSQLSYLRSLSFRIITRDNSGYDIGGYRDGTLFLARAGVDVSRVLYVNDSIYFFKAGLTEMFQRMAQSAADITGTFENWEFFYHVQSFCFAVSGVVFRHEQFQAFWREYLPVNSRRWAIKRGEIGLSRAMLPIASSIDILYKPNDLRAPLSGLEKQDFIGLMQLLPMALRFPAAPFMRLPKQAFIKEFVTRIGDRSQIHTGGFLYRKFLGCPLMKRDLLFRIQFTSDEIEQALIELGHEGHLSEMMVDFKKKGRVFQMSMIRRLLAADGIV